MPLKNGVPITSLLLERLVEAWLVNETPDEIGCDVEKIRLLKQAVKMPGAAELMSEHVRELYRQVFLTEPEQVASLS